MLLELKGVHTRYGVVEALRGVNLSVQPGSVAALIGANGAGKTTTLKTISALIRASAGEILFDGRNIARRSASEIVRLGIAHVPEGRQVFATQSVLNNLQLGGYVHIGRVSHKEWADQLDFVLTLFPDLKPRLSEEAGALSGGQQQMLAIARGLMTRPRLLLMDEPSLGLSPQIIQAIFDVIESLKKQGLGVLLVEQNAAASLAIADYGYVMEGGVIALEGSGSDLLHNEEVVHRYLGIGTALYGTADEQIQHELTENLRVILKGS